MACNVLVVEDEAFIREALAEVLESEGFVVQTAAHGGHGLRAMAEGPAFDLVLLDMVMPEVSGLQFRSAQLARPAWAHVPTIVLTADVSAAARMPQLRGARLAEKPLDLGELLRIVHEHCPAS